MAPPNDLRGIHVMVVDDSEDSLYLVRLILQYYGAVVTTSGSVEEARHLLRTVHPHIVVSDIGMPHNGLGVVRDVVARAQSTGTVIPAIAMTAFHERRQELLAAGFVEVVEKPFDPGVLYRTVLSHARHDREYACESSRQQAADRR